MITEASQEIALVTAAPSDPYASRVRLIQPVNVTL